MRRWVGVICLLLGLSPAYAVRAADLPMVLVLPWVAPSLPQESRDALGDFLVAELAKDARYQVMSLTEVNTMVGTRAPQRCYRMRQRDVCLQEILGALGAPYFVKGAVHRLHGQLYFNLVLFDVKHQRVANRASADYSDDDYFYPFVVHDLVQKLLNVNDARHAVTHRF